MCRQLLFQITAPTVLHLGIFFFLHSTGADQQLSYKMVIRDTDENRSYFSTFSLLYTDLFSKDKVSPIPHAKV